jgi:hypothetical protein
MTQVVISIDDNLAVELESASMAEHKPAAAIVADALKRRFAVQWLRKTNAEVSKRGRELGIPDEDSLLNSIS